MKKILIAMLIMCTSVFSIACSNSTQSEKPKDTTKKITLEEAKDIALKDAKLSKDKVEFVKTEEGTDNGVAIYDIEFYADKTEYDYEINAETGDIIESDTDIEEYTIPQGSNQNTTAKISEEKAKEIALKDANLTMDQVKFDRTELDTDNGVQKYDIEFNYNGTEYSYEINADTGEIIEKSTDKINS